MSNPAATLAVAKNAARHLIEANQHYRADRFASAVASAIFAIEETGKLSILVTGGKRPKSNQRHAAHAITFYAFARLVEDWQWSMEWQRLLRTGWTPKTTLTELQQRMIAEHPEYADLVRRLQADELLTVEQRMQAFVIANLAKNERDGTNARWAPVVEQGLNQRRIRATYVDVTESGFSSPETTDPNEADALCWLALWLLAIIVMMATVAGPLKGYETEVAKLLPDSEELIGAVDFTRFVEALKSATQTPT
jgi:hypothetical protein